jgi:hypothetical protein
MNFYKLPHKHYCGVDLHSRTIYLCIVGRDGAVLRHRNLPCDRDRFLLTIAPYREDLVVAVECVYSWCWLADVCAREGIAFVLGHAPTCGSSTAPRPRAIAWTPRRPPSCSEEG